MMDYSNTFFKRFPMVMLSMQQKITLNYVTPVFFESTTMLKLLLTFMKVFWRFEMSFRFGVYCKPKNKISMAEIEVLKSSMLIEAAL
jgi:hypothetical protein